MELDKFADQLVADDDSVARIKPSGARTPALLHFERDRRFPGEVFRQPLGHGLQDLELAADLRERGIFLRRGITDLDFRFWLVRLWRMRLQHLFPGPIRIAEVEFTRFLALLRKLHLMGKTREFIGRSAHQQADDIVRPLQVQAVFVIIRGRDTLLLVALIAEEPTPCGGRTISSACWWAERPINSRVLP